MRMTKSIQIQPVCLIPLNLKSTKNWLVQSLTPDNDSECNTQNKVHGAFSADAHFVWK